MDSLDRAAVPLRDQAAPDVAVEADLETAVGLVHRPDDGPVTVPARLEPHAQGIGVRAIEIGGRTASDDLRAVEPQGLAGVILHGLRQSPVGLELAIVPAAAPVAESSVGRAVEGPETDEPTVQRRRRGRVEAGSFEVIQLEDLVGREHAIVGADLVDPPLVIVAAIPAADRERGVAADRLAEPIPRDLERRRCPVQIDLDPAREAGTVVSQRDMMPPRRIEAFDRVHADTITVPARDEMGLQRPDIVQVETAQAGCSFRRSSGSPTDAA